MATAYKKNKRLTVGVDVTDGNTLVLTPLEDGGDYQLHPLVDSDPTGFTILLPHTEEPSYAVTLTGDLESGKLLAQALLALHRAGTGAAGAETDSEVAE